MTRLLLGLCLLFAGCAASPTTPRPVRVEVPLTVPCRVPDVRPPSWAGATLKAGESTEYRFSDTTRHGYLVPNTGKVEVNGVLLDARDGAAITGEHSITVRALEDAELVLVDTAA